MKLLLLGKNGQVGQELSRSLLPLGTLTALGRSELDLMDKQALDQTLKQLKPQIIVNAAAYTAVDKAEHDEAAAWHLNASIVSFLAQYAKKNNALLVHYSTDYVFDGKKKGAYQETDLTQPLNVYGASKLAGEQALLTSGCSGLIFRTSWVYSAHRHNFIKTILNLARHKESLRVVDDQWGAPTSAELIADVTAHAIAGYRRGQIGNGIYHLAAAGQTTWHGLACYAVERALLKDAKLSLKVNTIEPITTEEYALPAKRPKNSILDMSVLSSALDLYLPHWYVYVDRMINQLYCTHSIDCREFFV